MTTSLQRVRQACLHQKSDRVPVGPFTGFYAASALDIPLGSYVLSGDLIADAQIELQKQTRQDIVVTAADAYYLAEGFGLKVDYHDDALPTCEKPLFDNLNVIDSLCSSEMISPSTYRRFAKPYHAHIFSELEDDCRKNGAFTLLHICGDNRASLADYAETGADILEIDQKLDLAWCRQTLGDNVVMIGNLDPAKTILRGTPEEVRRQSIRCIEDANGDNGAFILGTGCFVPSGSPIENIQAMTQAAKDYCLCRCKTQEPGNNTHE